MNIMRKYDYFLSDLEVCKKIIEDHFKYSIKYASINSVEIIKIISKEKNFSFSIKQ